MGSGAARLVRVCERFALIVRNRDEGIVVPAGIDLGQIFQVEPTVQRGHGSRCKIFEQGKMNEIDMEMQKIKCVPAQMQLVQHGQVSGKVRLQQRRDQAGWLDRAREPASRGYRRPRSRRA